MADIILKTENLMKTYGINEHFVNAADRINISIFERTFTAIVGASGSGKSTLLHLLGGIDTPSGGAVYIYNAKEKPRNLYAMTERELAAFRGQNFGFVFQNYALIPSLTAWENVMIPSIYNDKPFDKAFANFLFEKLGITERRDHLPSEMSGGEQQRVALIRAIVNRPRILFADEPTGNLDKKNGFEIARLLIELKNDYNCTLVVVTHDQKIADLADCVITMDDGCAVSYEKTEQAKTHF